MANWRSRDQIGGPVLPSGKPLHFNYLLPDTWTMAGGPYPLLIDEHENDQGNPWYQSGQDDLPIRSGADGWYNTAAFQAAYGPLIIACPCCDQTTDLGGATENSGGWSGAGAYGANLAAVILLAQQAVALWNVDPARIYITGRSLGGIGTEAAMIDANAVNGASARVFAAGLALAGVIERYGGCPAAIAQQLAPVPLFMVSGAGDTTSRIQDFNRPLWDQLAAPAQVGHYPGAPGAAAGSSQVRYLEDAALGHNVWDTYMPLPRGKPLWDWLFSQRNGGVVSTTVPAPVAPAIAAAVGYNTRTFGPSLVLGRTADPVTSYPQFSAGANIVPYTFTGTAWKNIGCGQAADGSITLDGSGQLFGNGLATAAAGNPFTGIAFGGGGYFEVTMRGTGPMSFWFNDIETMNGASIGTGAAHKGAYPSWMEVDVAEFDETGIYGIALHNWYGAVGSGVQANTNFAKVRPPSNPDYTQDHVYAWLWVPATAAASGYLNFYFDGALMARATYALFDPAAPAPPVDPGTNSAAFPQTSGGGSAYAVIDRLHMVPIFGGAPGGTATFQRFSVWQASAGGNLSTLSIAPPPPPPLPPPVPKLPVSLDRTVINAGSTAAIIDGAGSAWTINAAAQVALNGVADTTTAHVAMIAIVLGVIWQCNASGNWYARTATGWAAATMTNPVTGITPPPVIATGPPTITATGGFKVSGGQIYDPAGKLWRARGVNNRPMDNSNAAAILAAFPGLTFVRLPMSSLQDPAVWAGFVAQMEAAKVVCLMEYHPWPLQPALTGTALAAEVAAAAAWASYYKARPYVWIGAMNEPQSGAMTPEHVAVYNAVRAIDADKMVVLIAGIGGGNPGATGPGALTASAYTALTNIVFDLHFYGWATQYRTDQTVVNAALVGSVAANSGIAGAQAIKSADGLVPVIIGEFGPSTSGASLDANAAQVIAAVTGSARTAGYAGWAWNPDPFNAVQASGQPTTWGKQLGAAIAAPLPLPPIPLPPAPPPPPVTLAAIVAQLDAVAAGLATVRTQLQSLQTPTGT